MKLIGIVDPQGEDYWGLADRAEAGEMYCRFAATGEQALRLAERVHPALWLINLNLPDMDGLELSRILRMRDDETPHFLIADQYDPQAETAALAGGRQFLCKPVPGVILEPHLEAANPSGAFGHSCGSLAVAQRSL